MNDYRPQVPFNVPCLLYKPTETKLKGVLTKVYPETGQLFYASVKTFGGTEKVVNGVIVIEDTAQLETWFNPDITPDCKVVINGCDYEIIGTPENINMRNQYMKLRVRAIAGGA